VRDPEEIRLDACAAEFVAELIDEIDERGEEQREALLGAFLCAAWPSRVTQDQ
jgi:hypothetical protein